MRKRIEDELNLLRKSYSGIEYEPDGHWVKIPNYVLPAGWTPKQIEVVFQIPQGYPGAHPYGIYVPSGLSYKGVRPNNYTQPANNHPSFEGVWGVLSWQQENWNPAPEITPGSNLLSWVRGFSARFNEGA